MNKKQLYILIAVVVVLAVIYSVQKKNRNEDWSGGDESVSQTLLPAGFNSEKIAVVKITRDGKTLTMKKTDRGWGVQERFGYPADFTALKALFLDLCETGIAQTLDLMPNQVQAMALNEKSGAAKVELLDADGKAVQTLLLGNKHSKKGEGQDIPNPYGFNMGGAMDVGRYLMLDDGRFVIAAKTFDKVDSKVTEWLDSEFFSVSEMKKAVLTAGGRKAWEVARTSSSEDLKLSGGTIPEKKELDSTKLNEVKNAFNYIRFADIAGTADKVPLKKASVLTVEDFDGLVYVISFDPAEDGRNRVQVAVSWKGSEKRVPAKDEKPEDKARKDQEFARKVKEHREKAEKMAARLKGWTYLVENASMAKIPASFDAFLKDKPAPEKKEKK